MLLFSIRCHPFSHHVPPFFLSGATLFYIRCHPFSINLDSCILLFPIRCHPFFHQVPPFFLSGVRLHTWEIDSCIKEGKEEKKEIHLWQTQLPLFTEKVKQIFLSFLTRDHENQAKSSLILLPSSHHITSHTHTHSLQEGESDTRHECRYKSC